MTRRTVLLLVLTAAATACGGGHVHTRYAYTGNDPATMENVNVTPGPMPGSETFSGVYHSQEIGEVNLEQSGDTVIGSYEYDRAACHARGRIEGRTEGNLLRFRWTEDQRECGRMSIPPGRGYFLFWKDSANNGRLTGEWGFGEDDSGNGRWSLFRSPNRAPHVAPWATGGGSEGSSGTLSGGSSRGGSGGTSGGTSTGGTGSSGGTTPPSNDPLQGL